MFHIQSLQDHRPKTISRHRTREKAEKVLRKLEAKVLRRHPNACTWLMYSIEENT